MYQTIGEKIEVAGVYTHATFVPKKFRWKQREFPIETITFITQVRDGSVQQRMYSILSKGNLYRLMFNRDTELWTLAEIWCE